MKTVTVKGKVYQIGGLYRDQSGEYARLKSADESKSNPFVLMYQYSHEMTVTTKPWKVISEIKASSVGTIEDAPIELEDGEWYMCEKTAYDQKYMTLLYYYDGFKSCDNSKLWSPVKSPTVLHRMVKA
tara:strand:+ start:1371 stop:1754 length:384 start_codon:yes stop_codon:yes gene_type:complete